MKKLITLATLLQLGTASASVVAIMDSGTDLNHKDLAPKSWTNKNEKPGSTTDLDGSGLPGDMHGWDFTENSANVFNGKYNYLLTPDVLKFYVLYAKYETKTITQVEFDWLNAAIQNKAFMNKVNFVGGYAHGTHVGGVAALNNSKAQIMSLKILPTVYTELPAEETVAKSAGEGPVQLELDLEAKADDAKVAPAMSVEDFKKEVTQVVIEDIKEMIPLNGYLKFHKVDVVNQSFGAGYPQVLDWVTNAFKGAVKRDPTAQELKDILGAYFETRFTYGPLMYSAAPDTLFVVASGNDGLNNDIYTDSSSVAAPNKIVVAATLGYTELADFSSYGATKVEVAAPGVAIQSTAPNNTYVYMSGTSQASPFVTNAAAMAKDINPALKVADIKSIILKTVDVKPWLKGKVSTSGIVNKARVNRAAELSKTMNVEIAIQKARAEIADVVVPKSFAKRLPGMTLKYKPVRPSLLVKLPTL